MCGQSEAAAVSSPNMLVDCSVSESGLRWYALSGYNDGAPFQAYTDVSIEGPVLVFYHRHFDDSTGMTAGRTVTAENSMDHHPTEDVPAVGTPGWGNGFALANVGTLVSAMCPGASNSFYVGQHDTDGTDLQTSSNLQWIKFTDRTGPQFVDMLDSTPSGNNVFSGTLTLMTGTSAPYKYLGGHSVGSAGVHQMTQHGTANSNTLFEYQNPGPSNHPWSVWGAGNGFYWASPPGSDNRYGWMGLTC